MGHAPAHATLDPPDTASKRAPGRPRCPVTHDAVLRAAYELLAEGGLSRFTIEGVAARSGVARTTIYRWWPSRGALAMEGFMAATDPEIRFPHTGSALADARAQLHLFARLMRGRAGRIVRSILAEGQSDPETLAAYEESYLEPRRQEIRAILERGIANGEFRPDIDVNMALSSLYSPVHFRLLLGQPLDEAGVDRLFDGVLRGLANPQKVAA